MSAPTVPPVTPPPTRPTKALVAALMSIAALVAQGIAAGEPWWVALLTGLGVGTFTGGAVYQTTNGLKVTP